MLEEITDEKQLPPTVLIDPKPNATVGTYVKLILEGWNRDKHIGFIFIAPSNV